MKPDRPGLMSESPKRPNLRPERLDLRPERPDLRLERLCLRPGWPQGGMDGQMDKRTTDQMTLKQTHVMEVPLSL